MWDRKVKQGIGRSLLRGCVVITLWVMGTLAVCAGPFTLTAATSYEAARGSADAVVLVALPGVSADGTGVEDVLSLRWVSVSSGWFPAWELRLEAREGLLDPRYVDRRSGTHEWIVLDNATTFPLKRDHVYRIRVAYDPDGCKLSFEYVDVTEETVLTASTVTLQREAAVKPLSGEEVAARYAHLSDVTVEPVYEQLAPPLALQRELSWRLVSFDPDGTPTDHVGFSFDADSRPGIGLSWPEQAVPGAVRIVLRQGQDVRELGMQQYGSGEQYIAFAQEDLLFGDSTLELVYTEGERAWTVEQSRFRFIRGQVDVRLAGAVRTDSGDLRVRIALDADRPLPEVALKFDVDFAPDQRDGETQTWSWTRAVAFVENTAAEVVFDVPAGPSAGTLNLRSSTATEGIMIRQVSANVSVNEAEAFRLTLREPGFPAVQTEPAWIRVGDRYPAIAIEAIQWEGILRPVVVRNGEVLEELPVQPVRPGMTVVLEDYGRPEERGHYEVRVTLERAGLPSVHHAVHFTVLEPEESEDKIRQIAYLGSGGTLEYAPDYLGNRIPDYSHAGYGGGGVPLPDVPVKRIIEPGEGDDTERIQQAINEVAAMPLDGTGFRGAVLLRKGTYHVAGTLSIWASGIVLRGEGDGEDGTVIIATGTRDRNLIEVHGSAGATVLTNTARRVTDLYVPVGATSLHVEHTEGLKVGDLVVVRRYGNADWISEIGMDKFPPVVNGRVMVQWTPFHLDFERVITHIEGNRITFDAPIMNAIEHRWGGGEVFLATDRRIEQIGIENLRAISEYDASVICHDGGMSYPCDEDHAQYLVSFNNVKNAWIRDVTTVHFAQGVVNVHEGAKWLTIQDAWSLEPVSQLTGSRRYPFHVRGQMVLVQRVFSQGARHAFAMNKQVTGPNVFLHSRSVQDHSNSEPHRLWAAGGLYDNVNGPIAIQDRWTNGSGHGWSGANFTAWNTVGRLVVQSPPTAQNWAIGHVGERNPGTFRPRPQGYWFSHGKHVQPQSLYLKQLEDRLGSEAVAAIGYPEGPDTTVEISDPTGTAQMGRIPPIVAAGAENLLSNPRLSGADNTMPSGWERYTVQGEFGEHFFLLEDPEAWSDRILLIDDRQSNRGFGIRSIPQPVQPGGTYTASALVRTEDGGKGYVYVDFLDAAGKRVLHRSVSTRSSEWTPLTVTLTAPPEAEVVTVLLYSDSSSVGKAFFDGPGLQVEFLK